MFCKDLIVNIKFKKNGLFFSYGCFCFECRVRKGLWNGEIVNLQHVGCNLIIVKEGNPLEVVFQWLTHGGFSTVQIEREVGDLPY